MYASDTGTGPAFDAWAAKLGERGRRRPDRRPRPRADRAGRGGGRGAGCAAGGAAPGGGARGPASPVSRRGGHRVPGAPGDPLHRHHRHQRQDDDHVADRARARSRRDPGRDGGQHRAAALRRGAGRRRRRIGWRWSSRRSSSTTRRTSNPRSASSPTWPPITSTAITRWRSTTATRRCSSATRTPASVWISNADDPAVQDMVAVGAGRPPPVLDRATRADGWYDRDGRRLMLGRRALLPARRAAPPGRSQRRQRARRRARGGRASGCPSAAHRRRAPDLPGHPAPGRAGARGGRRALDQRLQVHQHHLHRGGGGRARPAVRAAARRAAQGRALHPAGRVAAAAGAGPWWPTGSRARSWCRTWATALHGGAGRIDFDEVIATARRLAHARRRGAAVAGLLQLRHVQELRGARRALPARGGGAVTGRPVRHPGELRWETRLLGMVTAVLLVFGDRRDLRRRQPGHPAAARASGSEFAIAPAERRAHRRRAPAARLSPGLLPLAPPGVAAAAGHHGAARSSRCCPSPAPSRRRSTAPGAGSTSARSTSSRPSWRGSRW